MAESTIKRLLVPLDGSMLAESVLPLAAQLARVMEISVTLIHVIEKNAPNEVHGQRHLTLPKQAHDYLNLIADFDIFKGIHIDIHVHEDSVKSVSQSIADHSKELNQDLVLMCTHGSSGIHGMLFGSIAQQVISIGNTPVLIIHPAPENLKTKYSFEKFLIPLDGNPEHERVLGFAFDLAKRCGASVHLMVAIPYFGNMAGELTAADRLLPGTTTRMMDMAASDAEEYLAGLQTNLEQEGLTVSISASRNDPVNAIVQTGKDIRADLIILATHGRRGADAFWEGSITPKIGRSSEIPLLLVPVRQ